MKMIKKLNEIEDEVKNIQVALEQNPRNDEMDILNAVMDKLINETLEITQHIQARDMEMLSDMP